MDYARQQRQPARHVVGIAAVAAMHLLLGYALVTGLAHRVVEVVRAPVTAMLLEEPKVAPPPPPPPPPPQNRPPPAPRAAPPRPAPAPPPPAVVPVPEVQRPAPTAPAITSVPVAPPAPPTPPAPPAPVEAPPAPPAPPVRTAPVISFSNCAKPEYNAAARRAEAQGATLISFLIDTDGHVLESRIDRSSGATREHKMLDRLAVEALAQCRFKPGTVDGKPERSWSRVEYVWKLLD